MNTKLFLFSILSFLLLMPACSDNKEEQIYCTEEFVSISLNVKDKEGSPIALDSYKVIINEKDVTKMPVDPSVLKRGICVVVNDSMKEELLNKRVAAQVSGYIGENMIFETIVEVSANECHVYSLSKTNEIIVDIKKRSCEYTLF